MAKLTRETRQTEIFAEVYPDGTNVNVTVSRLKLTVKESKALRKELRGAEHAARANGVSIDLIDDLF